MPRALPWTAAQDAELARRMQAKDGTFRKIAADMGVSRSFVQRRAVMLREQQVGSTCTRDREDAGAAPLPAGHPITWSAIVANVPLQAALVVHAAERRQAA